MIECIMELSFCPAWLVTIAHIWIIIYPSCIVYHAITILRYTYFFSGNRISSQIHFIPYCFINHIYYIDCVSQTIENILSYLSKTKHTRSEFMQSQIYTIIKSVMYCWGFVYPSTNWTVVLITKYLLCEWNDPISKGMYPYRLISSQG